MQHEPETPTSAEPAHAPYPCETAAAQSPGRRTFLQWFTAGMAVVSSTALGVPLVGYFFGRRNPPESWVTLGLVEDFPLQETRRIDFDNPLRQPWDGVTGKSGVYARYEGKDEKNEDRFLVLSINCAHLGCPVTWFQQSGLFMCPCHGGVYYADGSRASGPPPRGLFECEWRVAEGRLQVQAPHYPTLHNTLRKTT